VSNDIIDVETRRTQAEGLKAWGWVSYVLHLIVAVGAVIPGRQPGAALLIIALVIDLVKQGEAAGTWQASHFSWRISTVIWGRRAVPDYGAAVAAVLLVPGLGGLGADLHLVPVPHRARHGGHEQEPGHRCLTLARWPAL
jgi:hypothetical protein